MKVLHKKTKTIKSIIYLAIALLAGPMVMAQEFNVGTNVISAGVGFGGNFDTYATSSQSPGLSVNYERGFWDIPSGVISLGGYVGTKTYKYIDNFDDTDKWSYTIIGVRGIYHNSSLNVDNLDLYGGLMASYNILSYSGSESYNSALGATIFAGGRYYLAENFAAFAELGYGVSFLNIGVSYRF